MSVTARRSFVTLIRIALQLGLSMAMSLRALQGKVHALRPLGGGRSDLVRAARTGRLRMVLCAADQGGLLVPIVLIGGDGA